ncbi:MAG: alpha/beta hydrolase fold domain-containing protein [Alphaproteobacteria bacterium]|nr:alpha/beta hydrolase fold domain-containing protein [Alphaproteobacteria bacterium]
MTTQNETATENWRAKIDPQQAAALERNAEIVENVGGAGETIAEIRTQADAARAVWNEGGPEMAVQQDLSVPGPFRDVPMRLYKPTDAADMPVFIYLHGGGFKLGSELSNDRQMRELAQVWGGAVISCDYVHAPEHTFPDPVIEVTAVVEWLAENGGDLGLNPTAMTIGGASAGASIAFGVAIELRDRKSDLIKGVVSIYGVVDDALDTDSMRELGGGDFLLQTAYVAQVYADYMGDADRNDPRAFAAKGDVTGLPPAFIVAAELDPIRDDSLRLAENMTAAGHPHRLKVYPGVMHTFFTQSNVIDQGKICIGDIADFLKETVGAT